MAKQIKEKPEGKVVFKKNYFLSDFGPVGAGAEVTEAHVKYCKEHNIDISKLT